MKKLFDPFSKEQLVKIFRVNDNPLRLVSRESSWLEFKQSFSKHSLPKYAKTMAAYANKEGGYIVFGIKNSPHDVIGLNNDYFDELDPVEITKKLREYFSPEIDFSLNSIKYQKKNIGIIYTYKSLNKPIICKKYQPQGDKVFFREGAVYYRYNAQNDEIKYEDLNNLLNEKQRQERNSWLKTLAKIARVGVNNVGILDMLTGNISAGTNSTLLLDENLLSSIKFITEGNFSEKEGAPTLKIIGNVQTVDGNIIQPTKVITQIEPKVLTERDVIQMFLLQEKVDTPFSYIETICHNSIKYLPFYYYLSLEKENNDKLTREKIIKQVKSIKYAKKGQEYLLKRFENDNNFTPANLTSDTKAGGKRRAYYGLLVNTTLIDFNMAEDDQKILFEVIKNIKPDIINPKYILDLLWNCFDSNKIHENAYSEFRKAVSYLDKLFYGNIF
ncbi:MAG: hypothetical protein ACD_20C00404G0001 [uncultured bacterium]|nr:MAG: hypothetical protein ACD_20C00404G0001 [uncultured bacterium]